MYGIVAGKDIKELSVTRPGREPMVSLSEGVNVSSFE